MKDNPVQAVSLIVCDTIITDVFTRKHSVVGIFNTLRTVRFPYIHGQLGVFAQISGGSEGKLRVAIHCASKVSGGMIFESRRSVAHAGGDHLTELQFSIHNITFPVEGVYGLSLLAGGKLLATTHFNVLSEAG